MATRSNAPSEFCKSTKEDLRVDGLKSTDDCPACEKLKILCTVACHPTTAPVAVPASVPAASDKDSNKLLIKHLKRQAKVMEKVLEVLEEIGDKDCYDRISESSKPRELAKSDYELAYGMPVADLKCMITGISQSALIAVAPASPKPKNPVTLSHLLARNAEAKERLSLGYGKADIENIRNSILLCKGIEEAFDHKFLSFVPTDKPFSNNRYKLHIWVD
eukprot:gene26783-30266_t